MTNSLSPNTGAATIVAAPSSAAPAAPASVSAADSCALHLSQPEASALISERVTAVLDAVTAGKHLNALIVRATTGAQKTTSVAHAVAACLPVRARRLKVIFVVRDHQQSGDYQSKLIAGGLLVSDVVIYRGRTDWEPKKPLADQQMTACFMPDAVRACGAKNHIPAATICQRCPIGLAMEAKRLREQIADGTAKEIPGQPTPEERLDKLEDKRATAGEATGMKEEFIQRVVAAGGCFLYRALPVYREANVLIIPQQAFNDSLTDAVDELGDERPCVVIADENLELAKERFIINGARLDEWREAVQPLQQYAGPDYENAINAIRLIEQMKAEGGAETHTIKKFLELYETLSKQRTIKRRKTAWWEQARWAGDGSGKLVAPLRAVCDLGQALQGGRGSAVVFGDDGIHVTTWTPLGERLIAGNAVLLDATISDSTIAALRAACDLDAAGTDPMQMSLDGILPTPAGKKARNTRAQEEQRAVRQPTRIDVLDIQVPQHVSLMHLDGRSYGRGLRGSEGYENRLRKTRQHLLAMILAARAAGTLEQVAFLAQKCVVDSDDFRTGLRAHGIPKTWIEERLGWWGKHDRAHNMWAGLNIIIQSLPWRSPGALRQAWSTLRALDPTLPEEPPEGFGYETVCGDLVQAIGRARAIYADPADPIRVTIAARVPGELAQLLEQHGLTIGDTRENPLASRRTEFWDLAGLMRQALNRIAERQGSATVLAIAAEVRAAGGRVSNKTMTEFAELLIAPERRGPKKIGYASLTTRYQRALQRWLGLARASLERRADRVAQRDTVGLRPLVRKLLVAIGAWLGWDPEPESTGLPPVPLPQAA